MHGRRSGQLGRADQIEPPREVIGSLLPRRDQLAASDRALAQRLTA